MKRLARKRRLKALTRDNSIAPLIYKLNESTWSSGWRRKISFSKAFCRSLPVHEAYSLSLSMELHSQHSNIMHTPSSKWKPLMGSNCETSMSSRLSAHPLLQPAIRSMAYNSQNVFLRTSSSTTSSGGGIREGVLMESERGENGDPVLSPRGIAARIAWAMVMKA
jgi:hypothetical protein